MLKEIGIKELERAKDNKNHYILVSRQVPRWIKKEKQPWDEWDKDFLAPSQQLLKEFTKKREEYEKIDEK